MYILLFFVVYCVALDDDIFDILHINSLRGPDVKINITYSNFPSLESYHENAKAATDKTYPWIAQIVQSMTKTVPYMCTAICVHEGIFITASRCIYSLKVKHTSIVYRSKQLATRAFVLPSKPSVQQYDDIGFVVIEKKEPVTYTVAQLYSKEEVKRTDRDFNWFAKMDLSGPFRVVGYVMDKEYQKIKKPATPHNLRHLPVVVSVELCWNVLTKYRMDAFHVPCYHSCSLKEFNKLKGMCKGYLAVEGAAVIHDKTKKVLGVATWGTKYRHHSIPVGFSIVNSKAFVEDFECAKKVSNAKSKSGSYQDLCKL